MGAETIAAVLGLQALGFLAVLAYWRTDDRVTRGFAALVWGTHAALAFAL